MGIKEDLVTAMKAYADARSDLDFRSIWGATGSRIQIRNETVDTGQGWSLDPSFLMGIFTAIDSVIGSLWQKEDFDLVLQSGVTLTCTPRSLATLMVFVNGALARYDSSPSGSAEYSLAGKTITFGSSLSGWVGVYYLKA